ncbi:MAG TPA: 2-succinyl-6-hydroxy-2,4-cyclohexadiene-1-carboxylate synthase [Candidatus Eisenbacteria bacterium]
MKLDIRDVIYHIEVQGDPARDRAVVLLHGFCGSSADWAALTPSLRAMGHAVVAIDLAGHGGTQSPADPSRYTLPETTRDLDAILTELGAAEADWVGYSMGGRVALHLALTHPARVRSLILESASPGIEDPDARACRREADDALAKRIEERGIEWFADYWSALPLFETQWELPPATLSTLRARRLSNLAAGLAGSLRGMGQGIHDYMGGRLHDLRCDVLLIAGERDLKYVEVARRTANAVPGSRCVVIPGAGHNVHLETPEAFAGALADHWNIAPQHVEEAASPS